jgi:hypothetical protein
VGPVFFHPAPALASDIPLVLRALERRRANLYTFFTRRFLILRKAIGYQQQHAGAIACRRYQVMLMRILCARRNMDILYIGLIVVFVALSIVLVHGCEKLKRKPQ